MKRNIRQIELSDDAFEAIEGLRQRNGMTQKEMIARIVTWIARLDSAAQQLVLGRLPADYAADAAQRLAQGALAIAQGRDGAGQPEPRTHAAKAAGKPVSVIHELPDVDSIGKGGGLRKNSG